MTLIAVNPATGKEVPIGSVVTDFRGDEATLVAIERVNEMRYGGHRSGKVSAVWRNGSRRSMYDSVVGLEVRETEWEDWRWPRTRSRAARSPTG